MEVFLEGMPRDKAYKIISQAVLGSAKMLLETEKHPGQFKKMKYVLLVEQQSKQ